jgi:hypothetical protein
VRGFPSWSFGAVGFVLFNGWYSTQLVGGANACPRTALIYPILLSNWSPEDGRPCVCALFFTCLLARLLALIPPLCGVVWSGVGPVSGAEVSPEVDGAGERIPYVARHLNGLV